MDSQNSWHIGTCESLITYKLAEQTMMNDETIITQEKLNANPLFIQRMFPALYSNKKKGTSQRVPFITNL